MYVYRVPDTHTARTENATTQTPTMMVATKCPYLFVVVDAFVAVVLVSPLPSYPTFINHYHNDHCTSSCLSNQ
jgi:hypothetical protein